MSRNIGLDVQPPEDTCTDPNCPFDGTLSVRGQVIEGRVASIKGNKTVIVERRRFWGLPKFDRYEKRTSRYMVHHPPCISLTPGDRVKIAECRPLSKTKSFVVVEAREGRLEVRGQDMGAPVLEPETAEEDEDDEGEGTEEVEA